MIKYIGSKRTIISTILSAVRALPDVKSTSDVFSGTSRVGHALKGAGYQVISNDYNAYAHTLAKCYVEADLEKHLEKARSVIQELMQVTPQAGYFTDSFCIKSRFFHPKNGERIDAIRERIEQMELEEPLRSVVLVSLMEAADRVDSTTGVQMAYLKEYAARAHNNLEMRVPDIQPASKHGPCRATRSDALDFSKTVDVDLCYLDPPYNQHSYLGNYHIWESLVLWDKPEIYGIACKRVDCRERTSIFNSKPRFKDAFAQVIRNLKSKYMVISFNNEGYLDRSDAESIFSERGDVYTVSLDYKRYVGAQIGIYNLKGEKVGKVSHLRNIEYVYVVLPKGMKCPDAIAEAAAVVSAQRYRPNRAETSSPDPFVKADIDLRTALSLLPNPERSGPTADAASKPDVAGSAASSCWTPVLGRMVAALFVETNGCYFGIPGVDPWDIERDARKYSGPHPVVAHPPCQRWGRLGAANYQRWGGEHNRPGNDGGCFASALESVRTWGGVLEHPAGSHAWDTFGLLRPTVSIHRGWKPAGLAFAGRTFVCEVWQSAYGHKANKATWLYYVCPFTASPPELNWDRPVGTHQVGFQDRRGKSANKPTLSKRDANATPPAFRDVLLSLASNPEVSGPPSGGSTAPRC